jgi:DNA primase large subunit
MGKKKQMAKSWMKSSWKYFTNYQTEQLIGEIMNEQMQKQLKMIEATLNNAKIDIELLQEENQKLTKLLSLFLVKTGDKLEEQVA